LVYEVIDSWNSSKAWVDKGRWKASTVVIQVRFINIKGMEPWELCHWEIFSPIVTPIEGSITN
jgi:hypothetical protein